MGFVMNTIATRIPLLSLTSFRAALLSASLALGAAGFAVPCHARPADGTAPASAKDYTLGPGDVLTVTVIDAPEFGGKFRVSDTGTIQLTGVPDPVVAEGQTTTQLAQRLREAFIAARQLRDPQIKVFVDEYHGRTVTVLGAVTHPSVYSLQKKTSVLEAISAAGGALPNSGNIVTIVRGDASAEATNTSVGSVQIVDLSRLTRGEDITANIEVRNGDVINVSNAPVVYVTGAVMKPGGFTMTSASDGISAAQAVALAQGFTGVAASNRALIVRQSTSDHSRREIPVDISKILKGEETDVMLAPNDILYVPNSGMKQTLKVLGDIAMATVNGIAIYGIGYKIGTSY